MYNYNAYLQNVRLAFFRELLSRWLKTADPCQRFVAHPDIAYIAMRDGTEIVWRCLKNTNSVSREYFEKFLVTMRGELNVLRNEIVVAWQKRLQKLQLEVCDIQSRMCKVQDNVFEYTKLKRALNDNIEEQNKLSAMLVSKIINIRELKWNPEYPEYLFFDFVS